MINNILYQLYVKLEICSNLHRDIDGKVIARDKNVEISVKKVFDAMGLAFFCELNIDREKI